MTGDGIGDVLITVREGRAERRSLANALECVWRVGATATVFVEPRGRVARIIGACHAMNVPIALLARDPETLERDLRALHSQVREPVAYAFADGWSPARAPSRSLPEGLTFIDAASTARWDATDGKLGDLTRLLAACSPTTGRTPPDVGEGTPPRLDGIRIQHITSVHRPRDVRIFHKEVRALREAGADARVSALDPPVRRGRRIVAGWRLVAAARKGGADVFHIHDPELLPAALWLAWRSRRPVIYDVHEYLGETTRTKRWLPRRLRVPLAIVVERAEKLAARRLAGVVTANEDLAARFALAGAKAISVTNSPYASEFPAPTPPRGTTVLYVGGLAPRRGLDIMKAAFPLVAVADATLSLVGPGDPGALPDRVVHLGRVDHSAVQALLDDACVAWIPLQRHGNYDRAVPTKLVEAMAAGRPVVASDLPRMASLVHASGCGIVVPADDPATHARAITQLIEDTELSARLGAAGRSAFVNGLAFETQAAKLVAFYREVLR